MTDNESAEQFEYGMSRRYVHEGRIAIIKTAGDMRRRAVDAWAQLLIDTIAKWDDEQPICVIHELTSPNQGFSPYVRQQSETVFDHIPHDRPVFSAVVLPDTFINRIIGFYLRTRHNTHDNHTVRVFTDVQMSIEWMMEALENSG